MEYKQTFSYRKYKNPMGLKFIDLFAGLGGFHLALQRLGHECVFASELKEDLQRLYEINFGGGVIHGDILSFNTSVKIYRTKKLNNGSRVTGSAI